MLGEALGDIMGPLLVFCFYDIVGATGIFCILAIFSFCVWMTCAVVMALEAERNRDDTQSPTLTPARQTYFSFVKSLLYN